MTTAQPQQDDELHSYYEESTHTVVQAIRRESGTWEIYWPDMSYTRRPDAEFREEFSPKTQAAKREYAGRNGTPLGEPTDDGWLFDDMEDGY